MRDKSVNTAYGAALLCAALALSYAESFVVMPVPGLKLGLANAVIVFAAYRSGMRDAVIVSAARITLASALFGGVPSLWFSFAGAALSLAVLSVMKRNFFDKVTAVGASIACAAAHNTGQIAAACVMFGDTAPAAYLPLLLVLSVPTGAVTGAAAVIALERVGGLWKKSGRR